MSMVIAETRMLYHAALDAGVVIAAGRTLPGEVTVSGATLVSAADENAFLGLVAGSAGAYNPLPEPGAWVEAGEIYGHAGGLVIVRQSHARTGHAPETVPNLFSVYREDAEEALEWVANERVEVGMRRVYEDVLYECIQAHTTQVDWTPDRGAGTLWAVVVEEPGEWVSGEQGIVPGDRRTYQGVVYECIQNPGINIWPPPTVLALWRVVS